MFRVKHSFRNADPAQSGSGATPPAAPVIDVQTQINQALAAQQADFAAQLEKATGHKDIGALTEAQLKAQGKLQELADAKAAEATSYKSKFEQAAIGNALLSAASEAKDADLVKDLLAGKAAVDEHGVVTIDGKPVADAVKALLDAKPFLAKAQGEAGSGAPQNTGGGKVLTRAAFEQLSPIERSTHINTGGTVI